MAKSFSLELAIRYLQTLSAQDARRIRDAATARLTAIGQSKDAGAFAIFSTNSNTEYVHVNDRVIIEAIEAMTHPTDTATLRQIAAVADKLGELDDEESSSSESSLSSQSSSSSSSVSSSSQSSSSSLSSSSQSSSSSSSSQSV